ncbi:alpha/beta hydrolase [Pseudomonas sp. NFACC13-1]|uniref:alpha/beta hydrolase n=1 Tax=Pseudomonas sp. NFACC13-1 TaxID=1566245 RepID=UPI0008845D9A|nr:alpha/beta hydrolase [Pseudomonas sp. NFACC13-1]SDB57115.1 Acetyl esterase/lipase [Pseudomonas sp. NFACC13-1]
MSFILRVCALLLLSEIALAGPLMDAIKERRAERQQDSAPLKLPAGARLLKDLPYGPNTRERLDVYLPRKPSNAPIIFMVHGGAWRTGDKTAQQVVANKVSRWVAKGFIFVCANYPLLPDTKPLQQAQEVAKALAMTQANAASWGGSANHVIVMGHSAGAHLVALLAASPSLAAAQGVKPWLGTVALDSAALDVEKIMQARHMRFYDEAFGSDPTYWQQTSPSYVLANGATPMLAVCSTRRDVACEQAHLFATHATALTVSVSVLEQDMTHKEINQLLGTPGAYTEEVERFMARLDTDVDKRLGR